MNNMATDKKDQEYGPASSESATPELIEDVESILETVVAERDRLLREKTDLSDQVLRVKAEFENFRRRTDREKMEGGRMARMDAVRQILPVLDALELALKSAAGAESELRRGVELTLKQFREILEKQGLKTIEAAGARFDPHIHHAVEMVETTDYDDQTVIEEYARGYLFHDQLLRPAMVRVASCPQNKK